MRVVWDEKDKEYRLYVPFQHIMLRLGERKKMLYTRTWDKSCGWMPWGWSGTYKSRLFRTILRNAAASISTKLKPKAKVTKVKGAKRVKGTR